MKKQYFGKDTKNGLRAIYAVAFTNDEEMSLFTRLIADEYGYEKYSSIPELFVDDDSKYKGRKPIQIDEQLFRSVYKNVREGKCTNTYAMKVLGLKSSTYYRTVKRLFNG